MRENMSGFVGLAMHTDRQRQVRQGGAGATGIGAAQERMERMLLLDREAHRAWVSANGWRYSAPRPRRWRQALAQQLMRLAARIDPTATVRVRQEALAQ
jgi:hypothetical protein